MSVGQGEVCLHQVGTLAEMCQCRLGNIDGQTVKLIAFGQLLEARRRLWPAPMNFDISDISDKHGVVGEVMLELAAAAETDRLLAKKDTEELVVQSRTKKRWQRFHLRTLEGAVFSLEPRTIAGHSFGGRPDSLRLEDCVDHQVDDSFSNLGRQLHKGESVDWRWSVGDLENLGAHFNNVNACFEFLRILLDHVGALGNGGGHRFSPLRAQANHAPKLPRVNDALMIPLQALQKCLNVLGQAVPRVHGLGLESVPRLA